MDNLPPRIHVAITTRENPPRALARRRARAELLEIRAADLRFTVAKAAEFLRASMGLNLAEEDSAALERRTEGWIAGLDRANLFVVSLGTLLERLSFLAAADRTHS